MEQESNFLTEILVQEGFKAVHKAAPFMTLRRGRTYDAIMYKSILIVFCQRGKEWEKLFEQPVYTEAIQEAKDQQIKELKEAIKK